MSLVAIEQKGATNKKSSGNPYKPIENHYYDPFGIKSRKSLFDDI